MKLFKHAAMVASMSFLAFSTSFAQDVSIEVAGYHPALVSGVQSVGKSIVIVNSTNEPKHTKVNVEIIGPNGELWLKAHSWSEVGVGANTGMSLNFNSDFILSNVQNSLTQFGRLPEVRQTVCVFVEVDGKEESRSCFNYQPEGLMAIENINPLDESILRTESPVFNWLPIGNLPYTHFVFLLGEKVSGGSEEIGNNIIRLESNSPNVLYPLESPALEVGKEYAWRVQAYWGRELVAVSDNWVFTLSDDEIENVSFNRDYLNVNMSTKSPTVSIQGELKFSCVNNFASGKLSVKLFSKKGKPVRLPESMTNLSYGTGENLYQFDFDEQGISLSNKKEYKLIVQMPNGDERIINFMYYRP